MKTKIYEGKTKEEALAKACAELNVEEKNIIYKTTTAKVGLLKKEVVKVEIFEFESIVEFIKEYLKSLTTDMGLEVTLETKVREQQITITMHSNNNSILIGHNGQTLQALTTVVKQVVYNETGVYPYIILDVENYKEKQTKYLERLAKNIANDVASTKVAVEMDNMNSYERRIVHNILTEDKRVYTESVGEEPNRHVVVKPKED